MSTRKDGGENFKFMGHGSALCTKYLTNLDIIFIIFTKANKKCLGFPHCSRHCLPLAA